MTTVKEVLDRKQRTNCRPVCAVAPTATVRQAVHAMNRERIGALVVTAHGDVKTDPISGIFTERDVLTRVVGEGRDPDTTLVGDVMTPRPVVCALETAIDQVRNIVTRHRIRHLPVLQNDRIVGLITSGDVLAHDVAEQEATIRHLHDYITG